MIKTSTELIAQLRDLWPDIQFNWLADRGYEIPLIAEIESLLPDSGISSIRFNGELMDCDDYALLLNAWIKRYRIENFSNENHHWAFGEVFCSRVNRVDYLHSLNICVAQEGVFLIEPQTYEVRLGHPIKDQVLLVKI